MIPQKENKRQFVIHTGELGFEMFNWTFEKVAYVERLRLIKGDFEQHEYEFILKMIDSESREDFNLAKAIIDTKYGSNI